MRPVAAPGNEGQPRPSRMRERPIWREEIPAYRPGRIRQGPPGRGPALRRGDAGGGRQDAPCDGQTIRRAGPGAPAEPGMSRRGLEKRLGKHPRDLKRRGACVTISDSMKSYKY